MFFVVFFVVVFFKHFPFCFRALQEAQDIFGVDFDFEEFEQYGEYDEDEEEEEDVVSCFQ